MWHLKHCASIIACAAQDPSGTSTLDRTQLQQLCCTSGILDLMVWFLPNAISQFPMFKTKCKPLGWPMNNANFKKSMVVLFCFSFQKAPWDSDSNHFKFQNLELRLSKSDMSSHDLQYSCYNTQRIVGFFHWKLQQICCPPFPLVNSSTSCRHPPGTWRSTLSHSGAQSLRCRNRANGCDD